MELSQEDRERIYLEEKARLEARQRLEAEQSPVPESRDGYTKHILWGFGIVTALGLIMYTASGVREAYEPPRPRAAIVDKAPEKQNERRLLIDRLTNMGVFSRVESSSGIPRVYVRRAFYDLDFETKQNFISVVYAYNFDGAGPGDAVMVYDARTGKRVGSFMPPLGLQLDEPN